jgi:hypothetical protein
MEVREDPAEVGQIEGGHQDAARRAVAIGDGLGELHDHVPGRLQEAVVPHGEPPRLNGLHDIRLALHTGEGLRRGHGHDPPCGVGQGQRHVGRIGRKHLLEQELRTQGVQLLHLARPGQGRQHQSRVGHDLLVVRGHDLNLPQGRALRAVDCALAQGVPGEQHDAERRQNGDQHQADEACANGGEGGEAH